jgi:hypothetical protein
MRELESFQSDQRTGLWDPIYATSKASKPSSDSKLRTEVAKISGGFSIRGIFQAHTLGELKTGQGFVSPLFDDGNLQVIWKPLFTLTFIRVNRILSHFSSG